MRTTAARLLLPTALLLALVASCRAPVPLAPEGGGPRLTHGAAVGEVTSTTAVVWGRCDAATTLHVRTDPGAGGEVAVGADGDFTGRIAVDGLEPGRPVDYVAWCGDESEPPAAARVVRGRFVAAPAPDARAATIRFAWGGDVGGQNVCRDADDGYFVFDRLRAREPDFFVALGDMIYADDACVATGFYGNPQVPGPPPSAAAATSFHEHWRYNRADPAFRRFLLETSYYAVWDDHEIVNDAGPRHDEARYAPGESRLAGARAAFLDYQPMRAGEPFHRRFRWGPHVDLFILDTRSHRDANAAADDGPRPKTMLGEAQRDWLVDAVATSDATWKIVISSVPLSIPTGGPQRGPDGWADAGTGKGFERELTAILAAWRRAGVDDVVFLTTDVHFATGFRYRPPAGIELVELVSGPLNAGMFPKLGYDPSFAPERLFLYAPPEPMNLRFAEARRYFNFGEIEVDAAGALTARIVNGDGEVVFEQRWLPS